MAPLNGHRRLKAMSLVETIVALVILVVIFSIVTYFLSSVESGTLNSTRTSAAYALDHYVSRTLHEKKFVTDSLHEGPFIYERTVTVNGNLVLIDCKIFDLDHHLLKRKRILAPND
jgi:Tfp pilus assembly protein PilV